MSSNTGTKGIVVSALLCSIGIIIPLFSPIKIILEPASFTLASHVAIFIAMFISNKTAIFVTLGTAIGFLLGGFPIIVVLRALSHLLFVIVGSIYLNKKRIILNSIKSSLKYSIVIGIVHAIGEILVVIPFYFNNSLAQGYYENGFIMSIFCLVGIGTAVHSIVDFSLSIYIWNALPKQMRQLSSIKI